MAHCIVSDSHSVSTTWYITGLQAATHFGTNFLGHVSATKKVNKLPSLSHPSHHPDLQWLFSLSQVEDGGTLLTPFFGGTFVMTGSQTVRPIIFSFQQGCMGTETEKCITGVYRAGSRWARTDNGGWDSSAGPFTCVYTTGSMQLLHLKSNFVWLLRQAHHTPDSLRATEYIFSHYLCWEQPLPFNSSKETGGWWRQMLQLCNNWNPHKAKHAGFEREEGTTVAGEPNKDFKGLWGYTSAEDGFRTNTL